jgi:hypothetical protein
LLKNLFANAHLFFKTGNVTGNFSDNAVITTQITICITYFFDKTKALHCVAKLRLHLTPLSLPVRTGLTGDRGQVPLRLECLSSSSVYLLFSSTFSST